MKGCCGLVDPGMDPGDATALAERFKALADPTRVRMLNLLIRNEELCVCDVQANFDLGQPTISHHLRSLREAGLVSAERRGTWTYYTLFVAAHASNADAASYWL